MMGDDQAALSAEEIDRAMAEIEKGQPLAGHLPDHDALERAERVLRSATVIGEVVKEIHRK